MIKAMYCKGVSPKLVRYDERDFFFFFSQQRRQARAYWHTWCHRCPDLLPALLAFGEIADFDIYVYEIPDTPRPTRTPGRTRISLFGARIVRRIPMIDTLAQTVGASWAQRIADADRAAGTRNPMNGRLFWAAVWRDVFRRLEEARNEY